MSKILNIFKGGKKGNLMPELKRIETRIGDNKNDNKISSSNSEIYLKIDKKNNLSQIDEDELLNIQEKFKEFKEKEEEKYESVNKIMNKFLENFSSKLDNIFTLSLNLSKIINKNLKIGNDEVEKKINSLINNKSNFIYKNNTLDLNKTLCENIGTILSFCYHRLEKNKIKDMKGLIDLRKKILNSKDADIYTKFLNYCKKNNENPKNVKRVNFYKEYKNTYENIPELVFVLYRFSNVTTIRIELDSFCGKKNVKDDEFLLIALTILNIYWLFNSLKCIKLNFISKDIEDALYMRLTHKIEDLYIKYREYPKKNNSLGKFTIYQSKWNFNDYFKLKENRDILNIAANTVSHKSFDFSNAKEMNISTSSMAELKKGKGTIVDIMVNPLIKNDYDQKSLNRADIVKNFKHLFDLMIISLFSLNNSQNINLELIMNDSYNLEFLFTFKKIYEMDWISKSIEEFHIFDLLLYNNVIKNIQGFNIEINSLDLVTFDKLLNFLYYNKTLSSLNISLFSADISYFPQFIYKILSELYDEGILKKLRIDNEASTYLFPDSKTLEEKMLNHLLNYFIYNLATLFEVIKKKKDLNELGFNFEIPSNIVNNQEYMIGIFKFILNVFVFVSNTKIKNFCILSPSTVIDCRMNPDINNLINSINLNKNTSLEKLSLQMQFYRIENINNFISTNLKILNIGDLDIPTLHLLCDNICSYKFDKNSSLEKLSIGLLNVITDFSMDLKLIFEKLFKIKIKNFVSLNIFTNIYLDNKIQYLYLLKILNYNWISEYRIIFNNSSTLLISQNKSRLNDLNYLVPHNLEDKLLVEEDFSKINQLNLKDNINKNEDIIDGAYWCLKYLFDYVYRDNLSNSERTKKIVFDILKYIYFIKTPKILHIIHKKS